MSPTILRPRLSERIAASESRTEAFARDRFGDRKTSASIALHVPNAPTISQLTALECLVDLCLRMDPIVAEVQLVVQDSQLVARLLSRVTQHVPLEVRNDPYPGLPTVQFGIGPADCAYVDASDRIIGFSTPIPGSSRSLPAGPVFAALEAAKYLFLRAVELAYETSTDLAWPSGACFDVFLWSPVPAPAPTAVPATSQAPRGLPPLALIGVGGVGAGYLWFLKQAGLSGNILLIDDDVVEWHNMNRLFFALISAAEARTKKVEAASAYLSGGWNVVSIPRTVQHDDAIAALGGVARAGGMVASAVGEPETRKLIARRGFDRVFDAATNSDGSAQILALTAGKTTCIDCHVRPRPVPPRPAGCGVMQGPRFAGVVPHLSAYAGALLAFEQVRTVMEPVGALAGVNTTSVMRRVEAFGRESTTRCPVCPYQVPIHTVIP